MKKFIILSLFLFPFAVFGASKSIVPAVTFVAKEFKFHEFVAHIGTEDAKDIKIYKYVDPENKATCYISYFAGWTNGNQMGLSCVK